ncbi:MAG TPA: PAS domain S-box protein [Thermoanaerobaculaceae bacterium]|nr:PAS domain S-box protein [Thermoanaerobaculaceae bacterium]
MAVAMTTVTRWYPRRLVVWSTALAALVLVVAGLGVIPHQREVFVARWRDQLVAVADDRCAAVERWVWERIGDARVVASYPSVVALAGAGPDAPAGRPDGGGAGAHLASVLASVVRTYGYVGARVVAGDGRTLVVAGESPAAEPGEAGIVRRCLTTRSALSVFRLAGGRPVVEFASPVLSGGPAPPVAVVVLVADPEDWLFPFLRRQAVVSLSAETLLVHREGELVVYLTPLRHSGAAPLSLRRPVSTSGFAAAAAVSGTTAFGEYVDYRGTPVFAVMRRVHDTPWAMVVKVDREEVLRPFRMWLAGAATLVAALAGVLGTVAYGVWRRQRLVFDLALARSQGRVAELVDQANDAVLFFSRTGRILDANRRATEMYGYAKEELKNLSVVDIRSPATRSGVAATLEEVVRVGARTFETVHRRKDGTTFPVEASLRYVERDGDDSIIATIRDISDRKRAEEALRESEEEFRTLADTTTTGIVLHAGAEILYANPAAARITGFSVQELQAMQFWEPIHPDVRELVRGRGTARLAGATGLPTRYETKFLTKDGKTRWVNLTSGAISHKGKPALIVTLYDITDERRLRELQAAIYEISEATSTSATLEDLFRSIHAIIGRLMDARNFYIALRDRTTGLIDFPYFVDEQDEAQPPRPPRRGLTEYVLRTAKPLLATPERFEELCHLGEVESIGSPSIDWLGVPLIAGERPIGVLVVQTYMEGVRYGADDEAILTYVSREVARAIEHKRAEGALRESEERYRQLVELSPDAVAVHADGRIVFVNPAAVRLLGATVGEELLGKPVLDLVHPEFRDIVRRRIGTMLGDGVAVPLQEEKLLALDGTPLDVEVAAGPLRFQGKPAVLVAFRDLTQRIRLEDQLRQSQKMEAVGRLAGGIAHDFNNVLQAMLSRTELLGSHAGDPARVRTSAEELAQHLRRGAALTRQLLLFSRHEPAKAEYLDLNEVVGTSSDLLRRLIRENVTFSLELAGGALPVRADRSQLDQVLMNLAVNASHAMPEGGRLVVRTGRTEPDRVWFETADTGHGIPEEIREHIFEPFFTTKERGGGTGLGLSVVHGIVTLHGGTITVSSRVGSGTTFRVVLPRAEGTPPSRLVDGRSSSAGLPAGHGARVLLVEDEHAAREALADILNSLDYAVTAVESGEDASALPPTARFDVLLTDLMLPGMTGSLLAHQLLKRWPALKVVVMSGYAEDDALRDGVATGALRFLQKPFDMATLALELHRALKPPVDG